MLECQRNGESSFAVSASTCIHKEEGVKQSDGDRARHIQGRGEGKMGYDGR